MVDGFDNSTMVPAAEGILAVDKIPFLERQSPLEIVGFGLVRSNLERMAIDGD